jgi:hypothetical protein
MRLSLLERKSVIKLPATGGVQPARLAGMGWAAGLLGAVACAAAQPSPKPPGDAEALLVSAAQCLAPGPASINHQQALHDVSVFEKILAQGYAGYETVREGGLDWDRLFESLRAHVALSPKRIPVHELQTALTQLCKATKDRAMVVFGTDPAGRQSFTACGGHLDAWTADLLLSSHAQDGFWVQSGSEGLPAGSVLLACTDADLAMLLQKTTGEDLAPRWRAIVLSDVKPPPLQCIFRGVNGDNIERTLPMRRLKMRPVSTGPDMPPVERHTLDVTRLTVRRLDAASQPFMKSLIQLAPGLRNEEALLLDVRGNAVGTADPLADFFDALAGAPLQRHTTLRLESLVTAQGRINALTCQLSTGRHDPALKSTLQDQRSALLKDHSRVARQRQGVKKLFKETGTPAPRSAKPLWRGALVVLSDRHCSGACESAVEMSRQLAGTLVVGENTAGTVLDEALPYRLPNSGIGVAVAATWYQHADSALRNRLGRGHLPDVWLDEEDPEPVARLLARCLTDAECEARVTAW